MDQQEKGPHGAEPCGPSEDVLPGSEQLQDSTRRLIFNHALVPERWKLKAFDEIEDAPPRDWLMQDLIGREETSVWYGQPGSGKSAIMGDFAAHVAAGLPWFGHAFRGPLGLVVYVAAERAGVVCRRLAALRKRHGLSNIPLVVLSGTFDLGRDGADTALLISVIKALAADVKLPISLIVIDTLAQVLAGEDDCGAGMTMLVANTAKLRVATSAHIALVHHTPVGDDTRPRGRGDLLGAADATFLVRKVGGQRRLELVKVNDGPEGLEHAFDLESVELRHDPDGLVTSAPVVVELEKPSAGKALVSGPGGLSTVDRRTLEQLEQQLAWNGRAPPEHLKLDQNVLVVTEREWREACRIAKISNAAKQEDQDKVFRRSRNAMKKAGIVGVDGGFVWKVGVPS